MSNVSYFNNNELVVREGDGTVVGFAGSGGRLSVTFIRMDGYAIIPKELYYDLLLIKSLATIPPDPSAST